MSSDELRDAVLVFLAWDAPSRWQIGDALRALRQHGGEEAVQDAIPADDPKAARLAVKCLRVADRWPIPEHRSDDLEWGHYARLSWLDDGAATGWLWSAKHYGWSPAQMSRAMAGFDPDEPGMAGMMDALADYGGGCVTLRRDTNGQWEVVSRDAGWHPTYTAAIKATYRAQFGAKGSEGE